MPCRLLLIAASTVACGGAPDAPPPASDDLREVLEFVGEVDLEENDAVINVNIDVSIDPMGGFLVADRSENQIRRYHQDGRIDWYAGRAGGGPEEFMGLMLVRRLTSGAVLAADRGRKFAVFNAEGDSLLLTTATDFRHVEDVKQVDDSTLLVAAESSEGPVGPRLHFYSLRTNQILGSFFAPFSSSPNPVAATTVGWVKATIRGDTIAAIFATSDTVYYFDLRGEPRGKVPLPSQFFRVVHDRPPENISSPRERAEWLAAFDFIADIFWLPSGEILISYQAVLPELAMRRQWNLLAMTVSGQRLFEVQASPPLFAVDETTGSMYFRSDSTEVPNKWTVATLGSR